MNQKNSRNARIPAKLTQLVLERDEHTCKMCGQTIGDMDPYNQRPVQMKVEFIVPLAFGGPVAQENLRTICSTCADGLKKIPHINRPSVRKVIEQMKTCRKGNGSMSLPS
jgi:5-methylcytosine-specific restriction endonuclease McrA